MTNLLHMLPNRQAQPRSPKRSLLPLIWGLMDSKVDPTFIQQGLLPGNHLIPLIDRRHQERDKVQRPW